MYQVLNHLLNIQTRKFEDNLKIRGQIKAPYIIKIQVQVWLFKNKGLVSSALSDFMNLIC